MAEENMEQELQELKKQFEQIVWGIDCIKGKWVAECQPKDNECKMCISDAVMKTFVQFLFDKYKEAFNKGMLTGKVTQRLQDKKERDAMVDALKGAQLQIEYLHGQFHVTISGEQTLARIKAILSGEIIYGCHCDLEEGQSPADDCVMDDEVYSDCTFAEQLHKQGKDKTACKYWKPI